VKRLGQAVAAAVLFALVSGCGLATSVTGQPVAPPLDTAKDTGKPPSPATTRPSAPQSATPPATTTTTTSVASVPESVVRAYFDAINTKDYQRAWALGGKNVGQPFEAFAAGFAATDRDDITIVSVQGNVVTAELTAFQTDGTSRKFRGTYTVTGDAITRFAVREIK
jgi:hypothetical protein